MTGSTDMTGEDLGALVTETADDRFADIDLLSTRDLLEVMNEQDAHVAGAVHECLDAIATAVDVITAALGAGGRLIYVGAGTAGRLGVLDASECPPTFSTDPSVVVGIIAGGHRALTEPIEGAEDDPAGCLNEFDRLGIGALDVVVGIAASGRTPYTVGALREASRRGAQTVAISCNRGSLLGQAADIAIEVVVGPEVVSGSTRLKSGTAQKLVCNMLSTAAMIRLGKTYGTWMVDVRATNEKLRARARRIVTQATGVDDEHVDRALADHDGRAKPAILQLLTHATPERVTAALEATAGSLRQAQHLLTPPGGSAALATEPTYLGIDIGGSTTRALLCDQHGNVLHRGTAPGANPRTSPHTLHHAITTALHGCDSSSIQATVVGASGAGPARADEITAQIHHALTAAGIDSSTCTVVPDLVIAYRSAATTPHGRLLLAGTGAIAARFEQWHLAQRSDGLGWLLGDTGAGAWLGREILRTAAAGLDGRGRTTTLTNLVCEHYNLDPAAGPQPLIRATDGSTAAHWAALAPLAFDAADDPTANDLLDSAADALLNSLTHVGDGPVVLAGGLLTPTTHTSAPNPLRQRLEHELGPCPHATDPVWGACLLAADTAGTNLTNPGDRA